MGKKNKFKNRENTSPVFKDVNKSEELPVLISFSDFSHKDSPKDINVYKKMHEALHEVCKLTWMEAKGKPRSDLGGLETIPVDRLSNMSIPSHYDKDHIWVMRCGTKVARLFGYIERIQSGTIFNALRLASAQDCPYDH